MAHPPIPLALSDENEILAPMRVPRRHRAIRIERTEPVSLGSLPAKSPSIWTRTLWPRKWTNLALSLSFIAMLIGLVLWAHDPGDPFARLVEFFTGLNPFR